MKEDDRSHSIRDLIKELKGLEKYASSLPELEKKHMSGGIAEIAAIIRRLRDETSASPSETNKIQAVRYSATIDQATNPFHLGKETVQALLDAAEAFAFLMLPDGTVTAVNKWVTRMMGKPESELIGKSASFDLPADVARLREKKICEVVKNKKHVRFEDEHDGRFFLHNLYPIINHSGDVRQIAVVGLDITGQKKAEEDLKKSEARLRTIYTAASDIIVHLDKHGTILDINKRSFFGHKRSNLIGRRFHDLDFIKPSNIPILMQIFKDLMAGDMRQKFYEVEIHDSGGNLVYLEASTRLIPKEGNIEGFVTVVRNITERKKAEKALQKSQELLEHAVDGSNSGEWELEFGSAGREDLMPDRIYISPRLKKMIGFEDDEFPNSVEAWRARILREDLERLKKASHDHLRGRTDLFEIDYRIRHKDGSIRWMFSRGRIQRDEQGVPLRWTGIDWDITEHKQAEEFLRESEERYHAFLRNFQGIAYKANMDWSIIFFHGQVHEITGYTEDEFIGGTPSWFEIIHPDDIPKIRDSFDKIHDDPKYFTSREYRIIRKDSSERWVLERIQNICDETGKPVSIQGTIYDITERKQMEEALKQNENMLRIIFAAAPIGIGMTKDRIILWGNEWMEKMTGHSRDNMIGKSTSIIYENDEEFKRVGRKLKADIEKYGICTLETKWRHRDGRSIDILLRSSFLDRSDLSAGLIFTATDITESKRADRQLRMVQFAIDHSSDAAFWVGNDAKFIYVNNSACRSLGYTRDELMRMSVFEIDPDFSPDIWSERWNETRQKGSFITETRHIAKDGEIIPVEIVANFIDFGGEEYICAFSRDITERRAAKQELEKSREVYRALAENSTDVIVRYDRQMKCVYANQACGKVLGLRTDDIIGKRPAEMNFDKKKAARVEKRIRRVFSTGKAFQGEVDLEGKEGKRIFDMRMIPEFTSSGEVETVLSTGRDITETKRLQEFTSRAMRLEAAGRIAGQVAHDFNNLLGPLMAYPDLINDTLPAEHEALPLLDDMKRATEQIAEINQQLLTLGRRGHYNLHALNLNELIDHINGDIFPVPSTLMIEKDLADDLMNIKAGRSQILRALSNLIRNARDAMQDIGHLTITTENIYVEDTTLAHERIPAGEYVRLTIADTGCGMSEDVLANIFEPFYTTKTANRRKGSGLGLSVVHAVMEDHNGYIDCESTVGVGTTMYLYFPITSDKAEEPQTDLIVFGSERILVVDDDEIQRDVALTLLKKLGYEAMAAESGEKALELLKQKRFDLLILDMVMPNGLDGAATFSEALKINPDQKAIIISGYAESERVSLAQRLGISAFHKKPLALNTFALAVRKELDKKSIIPKRVRASISDFKP